MRLSIFDDGGAPRSRRAKLKSGEDKELCVCVYESNVHVKQKSRRPDRKQKDYEKAPWAQVSWFIRAPADKRKGARGKWKCDMERVEQGEEAFVGAADRRCSL